MTVFCSGSSVSMELALKLNLKGYLGRLSGFEIERTTHCSFSPLCFLLVPSFPQLTCLYLKYINVFLLPIT